jgi:hypothetical protein
LLSFSFFLCKCWSNLLFLSVLLLFSRLFKLMFQKTNGSYYICFEQGMFFISKYWNCNKSSDYYESIVYFFKVNLDCGLFFSLFWYNGIIFFIFHPKKTNVT